MALLLWPQSKEEEEKEEKEEKEEGLYLLFQEAEVEGEEGGAFSFVCIWGMQCSSAIQFSSSVLEGGIEEDGDMVQGKREDEGGEAGVHLHFQSYCLTTRSSPPLLFPFFRLCLPFS